MTKFFVQKVLCTDVEEIIYNSYCGDWSNNGGGVGVDDDGGSGGVDDDDGDNLQAVLMAPFLRVCPPPPASATVIYIVLINKVELVCGVYCAFRYPILTGIQPF